MRAVLQSVVSVIGGEAAVRAANFGAVLVIARAYGRAALGAYAVSLAVVTVVVMFADNGLQTAAITQISSLNAHRNQIIGRLTASKSILLAMAAILLAVVAGLAKQEALFLAIGFWVTIRAILQSYSQLQMAVLKSVSKANWIGIIQCVHSAILFAGIWLAMKHGWTIFSLLGWLASCQLLELLLGTAVLYRNGIWPSWPARLNFFATVKMAAPFGIAFGLANLIIRSDTIVLSTLIPLAELGAFSAANTILLIVYVCAWLFGSILLPEMVRLSGQHDNLKMYTNQWMRLVVLVSAPAALLVSLAAPKAIFILYGPAFAGSGTLASIMVIACPLILLNSIYTARTIATNSRAIFLGIFSVGALASLALDFIFGRAYGSVGVAWAIVVREAGMLLAFSLLTSRLPMTATGLELRASSGGS
ncbi:MAG TPA: oligosaccharide flippase family protein [Candidatus Acidoferrales bacterium]|jgi:O-antigen/teichoic acid export membrane protein|nr:oligosaccharide flippase family protein [Candidatus Acidoferrales bacterium]